ncbi:hypothetical protein J7I93_01825 [Bacillus sp. ISL-47]|uniref:hypothetical protein n=1 Tax=Bacillus sp. ISL-47 TaxID=2819130 RepID=UPI001BE62BDA|nr:hypothetical protein [Bacillus sp. ISL-47]MBT2686913.1 hypothetical protein [Bacillus sp. ISL-47]MBT2710453.1 hypothetical protein [Pseudomonas sp. ISL-84]
MYHIGVVGPEQSVKRILDVAKEFEKEMKFHPYTYKQAVETKEIVVAHKDGVDAWLFSGPIPYAIAKGVLGDDESLHGVLFLETGLYKSLLNLLLQNRGLKQLSVDLPEGANISGEALSQLEVPVENLHIETFPADIEEDQIYEYHYRLWENRETEGVLTCYPGVKERLKGHGIPVSWITTTRLETKQTLMSLSEKAKAHYYQNTQVAVCFIETENPELEKVKEELLYDMQWTELKMDEILLRASRSLNGSFHKTGRGDYMIFSSRGEVYHHINLLHDTIDKIREDWKRPVAAGIGFGDSVLKAEFNARKAVQRSKSSKQDKIILLDEHGIVEEYQNDQVILSYISESDEPELVKKLGEYHISVQLYNKIKSYVGRKDWDTFTSKDIALELGMSNRNAQRILQGLRKAGLIAEVGETKSHDKGRPMKLYSFTP